MKLTPKVQKTLDIAAKLIIAALSVSYIVYRVSSLPSNQIDLFLQSMAGRSNASAMAVLLVVLMIVNWSIESLKWKLLIRQSEEISFRTSFAAILGGLAVSIFTPNRVGEFVGRVFILTKTDPVKGVMLTIAGSFSQLMATVMFGTLAYFAFSANYLIPMTVFSNWVIFGLGLALATVSWMLLMAFFHIPSLRRLVAFLPERYLPKISEAVEALAACPKPVLMQVLTLSSLRYMVFSAQFYLMLLLTGLQFPLMQCAMVIPLIYLAMAAIPTIALTELGVRGSVSVFLFALLAGAAEPDPNTTFAVLSASTLIWLLNIALPALAGVLVVFRLKFFDR